MRKQRHVLGNVADVAPVWRQVHPAALEQCPPLNPDFSAIVDSAGGYAGFTLFPADSSVLTVEFKVNLLAPAEGERLIITVHL